MKESITVFQDISLRRRIIISIGILTVLMIVIGLYGLVAIIATPAENKSLLSPEIDIFCSVFFTRDTYDKK